MNPASSTWGGSRREKDGTLSVPAQAPSEIKLHVLPKAEETVLAAVARECSPPAVNMLNPPSSARPHSTPPGSAAGGASKPFWDLGQTTLLPGAPALQLRSLLTSCQWERGLGHTSTSVLKPSQGHLSAATESDKTSILCRQKPRHPETLSTLWKVISTGLT